MDEAFVGPRLQPVDPRERARVNQMISIADAYIYPILVWGVYVERVSKPSRGESPDEARLAKALAKAPTCLEALSDIMADADWLDGSALTLADLHLAPMFHYFTLTPEGREMAASYPRLASWWARMEDRASMRRTRPTT